MAGFAVVGLSSAWMASCGGGDGTPVLAQAAISDPLPGATYDSPARNLEPLDLAAIHSAKHSIDLAAYALTDKAIADELAQRAAAGVTIRIYRDHTEVASECRGDTTCARAAWAPLLAGPGVQIRVKRSTVLMHLKAYEIDGVTVRDGSANFSPAGLTRQDNSAIYSADSAALAGFAQTFQAMWDRPDNLTVAQAVQTAPKWGKN